MNPWVKICVSLYRRLARAYPHEFRMICGDEMERLGEDAAPEIWRRYGFLGLVRLLSDVALRLPGEYLAELRQDILYAARRLRQAPGFTAVGVLSVGMGIGMCLVLFTQLDQMALRPLPGASGAESLAGTQAPVPYPYLESYREQREIATDVAAFLGPTPFAVGLEGVAGPSERVRGHIVSFGYFETLGVAPSAGRFFDAGSDTPGTAPVVVVSDRFWRTHLHSDPRAVGQTLRLNGRQATIIGIGPRGFRGVYTANPADLFVPVTVGESLAPELRDNALQNRDAALFRVVLRLADGVTLPEAEAALDVVTRTLDGQKADAGPEPQGRQVALVHAGTLSGLSPRQRSAIVAVNLLLLSMILALASANLASLLLARTSQRRREIAIRLAIGASRFRLVRQLLTESVMLSLAGGAAGLALYYALVAILGAIMPEIAGFDLDTMTPGPLVLLVTLIAAFVSGLAFGLTPALAAARSQVASGLKDGSLGGLRAYRRFGIRNLFVVYQVAASLMLLLITGYVVVGYQYSMGVDPGFEPRDLYVFSVDPARDGYSAEQSAALMGQLPERLARLGEVNEVALADRPPYADIALVPNTPVSVPATESESEQALHNVVEQRVGARYFATLQVPILLGREFELRDVRRPSEPTAAAPELATTTSAAGQSSSSARAASEIPAVINQTAARDLFDAKDPLGRRIRQDKKSYVVVGVSQDVKPAFLSANPVATIFLPLTTEDFGAGSQRGATVVLRGAPGSDSLTAARREMEWIEPPLTVFGASTMKQQLDKFRTFFQSSSVINSCFGLFGLILASIGLAGVTSYAVARRHKEIGIRMALGARRGQVLRLVLREGVSLTLVGAIAGFLGSFALARAVASITDEFSKIVSVGTGDPILVVGAPALLVSLALLACYLPARRTTRIDPLAALRQE